MSVGDTAWTAEVMFPFSMLQGADPGGKRWRVNCHRVMRDHLVANASWYAVTGPWHSEINGNRQPFGRLAFE